MSASSLEVPIEMDCGKHTNYFDQLPDEMLLKIFSNLQLNDWMKVVTVCRRFKNVVSDKSFWKSTALTVSRWRLKRDDFDGIIQFPIKELELSIDHIHPIDGGIKNNFRKNLDKLHLESIFARTKLRFRSVQYVLNKCEPKHLILERISCCKSLLDCLSKNGRLEVLSMRNVEFVELFDRSRFVLCTNLKELDLGTSYLRVKQFENLLEWCPKSVERLIWGHVVYSGWEYYNDFCFTHKIIRNFRNLKLIGVSVNYIVKNFVLDSLAGMQLLDTLRFCYCEQDRILEKLVNILSKLRKIRTIQITIGERVSEKSRKRSNIEFDRLKRQMKDHNNMDFEVQYIAGPLFCNN